MKIQNFRFEHFGESCTLTVTAINKEIIAVITVEAVIILVIRTEAEVNFHIINDSTVCHMNL